MFKPTYRITPHMAKRLMEIQAANTLVEQLPLPANVLRDLQRESHIKRVVLSTKIEGSRLDERQLRAALHATTPSGEEQEVVNLWKAMNYLDECAERRLPITEELIKKLHAIIRVIRSGRRPSKSEYREQQNVITDERTGTIVYMPPEWTDVPILMEDLVAWINQPEQQEVPVPIKAGIFMWQFLTIHPYMDGNGRTARALATYLLRQQGLWLKGLFILESYYDRRLEEYYRQLQMGLHHNYYFGRNDADLTAWLTFFINGLAEVFQEAAQLVRTASQRYLMVEPELLRNLDPYQRTVFAHMALKSKVMTMSELYKLIDVSERTGRERAKQWIGSGFIKPKGEEAQRIRSVVLTDEYEELAQTIRENVKQYQYLLGI